MNNHPLHFLGGACLLASTVLTVSCTEPVDAVAAKPSALQNAVTAPLFILGVNEALDVPLLDETGRHQVAVYPDASSVTASAETDLDGNRALHFNGGWLEVTNALPESAGDFQFAADEDIKLSFAFRSEANEHLKDTPYAGRAHALGLGGEYANIDVDFGDAETTSNEADATTTACWTYFNGGGTSAIVAAESKPAYYLDGNWHTYVLERHGETISVAIDGAPLGSLAQSAAIGSAEPGNPNFIGRESVATGKILAPLGPYPAPALPWFGWIAGVRLEATSTPAAPALSAELQQMLDEHNADRAEHCAKPLEWDAALAATAQAWAAGCTGQHENPVPRTFGENIYFGWPTASPAQAEAFWYDEELPRYDFATPGPQTANGETGHFTQIVWRNSTHIGCGKASCPNLGPAGQAEFWVCRFTPAGNIWNPGEYAANVLPVTDAAACP